MLRPSLYLRCALAGFLGGVVMLSNPEMGLRWQGVILIAVGFLSLALWLRRLNGPSPKRRKQGAGPALGDEHPDVAALDPTTTTHLVDRVRRVRQGDR